MHGTLGIDSSGNPCLWLQRRTEIGEFRIKPNDMGTSCMNTKIVRLRSLPNSDDIRTHAYPVEDLKGYTAYLLVEELLENTDIDLNT